MCRKFEYLLLAVIILMIGTAGAQKGTSDFPILTGPYLGQKPPGKTPKVFAPGIILTLAHEYSFTVSPDALKNTRFSSLSLASVQK
jgi:hypothetical protein